MMCKCARVALAGMILATSISALAYADECKLGRLASLDFTEDTNGRILIPVSIEGASKSMLVDTGGEFSAIDPKTASDLHLITHRLYEGFVSNGAGEQFTQSAVLHTLDIGQMHAEDMHVLIWPSVLSGDGRIAGLLGADFFRHYDIDIDFGAHKFNVFSQDHCPGQVVYWPAPAVAIVPMHVVNSGHIILPITLDSHEIDALLDTGASTTHLSLETAEGTFKLQPNSPEMTKTGEFRGSGQTPVYEHTFKTLELQGITISNPAVYIWDNLEKYAFTQSPHLGSRLSDADERSGVTDMTLGTRELRHLHIYIAYKEQRLYITPAAAPATADASSPASAAASAKDAAAARQ